MAIFLHTLLILGALLAPPAKGEDSLPDPQTRLDDAVRLYMSGDLVGARTGLTDLLNDDSISERELRVRARIYLGEVLYVEGQRAAAWDAFRVIIREQPDFHLDPYEHPPDIVEFYETVRAATTTLDDRFPPHDTLPLIPEDNPSFPLWGVLPFGAYQIAHDRPVRGSLLALGQVATGAVSVALLGNLVSDHDAGSDPDLNLELSTRRNVQWACTTAFYGLWITGVVDASSHWKKGRNPAVSLTFNPVSNTAGITFGLR